MKNIFLISLLLMLFSCGNNFDEYQSEYYQDEETKKECLEPENPYNEGSGHYAGYERGLKGNNCSGNSNSFIEGCEEYYSQESDYDSCIK